MQQTMVGGEKSVGEYKETEADRRDRQRAIDFSRQWVHSKMEYKQVKYFYLSLTN